MYQKGLTVFLAIVALFSISYGITGFAVIEPELCQVDSDCQYAVCCPLQGKGYGVCDQEDACAEVYSTSKDEILEAPAITEEQASRSYLAVMLGILILFILGIIGYYEWQHEHHPLRKKRSKR